VYTVFAPHSLSFTISPPPPPPTGTNPPTTRQDLFDLPVLQFCKRGKKVTFLLKIATKGVFLWHFHVLQPELVHLLYFFSFYLSPLLMVVSIGLKILYSFLCREYLNHVHLLNFLLLPSPFPMWLPLSLTCSQGLI
jgi:hypothetical protein